MAAREDRRSGTAGAISPSTTPASVGLHPRHLQPRDHPLVPLQDGGRHRGGELWRRTVRDLDQLGLLARSDGAVVLAYAAAWEQLERAVADNPHPTVPGSRSGGQLVRSPGFLALRDASLLVRQLGAELGLAPAARARVSRTAPAATSLADLLGDMWGGGWLW